MPAPSRGGSLYSAAGAGSGSAIGAGASAGIAAAGSMGAAGGCAGISCSPIPEGDGTAASGPGPVLGPDGYAGILQAVQSRFKSRGSPAAGQLAP